MKKEMGFFVKEFAQGAALLLEARLSDLSAKPLRRLRYGEVVLESAVRIMSGSDWPLGSGRLICRLLAARDDKWLPHKKWGVPQEGKRADFAANYALHQAILEDSVKLNDERGLLLRWVAAAGAFAFSMNDILLMPKADESACRDVPDLQHAVEVHKRIMTAIVETPLPPKGQRNGATLLRLMASHNLFALRWNAVPRPDRRGHADLALLFEQYVAGMKVYMDALAVWGIKDAMAVRNALCAASVLGKVDSFDQLRSMLFDAGGKIEDLVVRRPGAAQGPDEDLAAFWKWNAANPNPLVDTTRPRKPRLGQFAAPLVALLLAASTPSFDRSLSVEEPLHRVHPERFGEPSTDVGLRRADLGLLGLGRADLGLLGLGRADLGLLGRR